MVSKINVSQGGGAPLLSEGVQEARIARVIDLGLQPPPENNKFNKGPATQLLIMFELAEDKVIYEGDEKSACTYMRVNFKGGPRSTLYKLFKATGLSTETEIDLPALLGRPIALNIENKKGSDNIVRSKVTSFAGVTARAAASIPELSIDSFFFDFDSPKEELVNIMSEFLKDLFRKALNYKGSALEKILETTASIDQTEDNVV